MAALGFTTSQIIVSQQNRVAEPESGAVAVVTPKPQISALVQRSVQ
jgi:hypothetical protein